MYLYSAQSNLNLGKTLVAPKIFLISRLVLISNIRNAFKKLLNTHDTESNKLFVLLYVLGKH